MLAFRMEEVRQSEIYGVRPQRTFREGAAKYVAEAQIVRLKDDVAQIKLLDPYIGRMPMDVISHDSLKAFIRDRVAAGVKNRTVNYGLQVVRRILTLAAEEWRDQRGLTWLIAAPKINRLSLSDARAPYPLNADEQRVLFGLLPSHLRPMALFMVNTGTREQEVCGLRWEWEVEIPELDAIVFVIPKEFVKNRQPRLVVLNRVALVIVDGMRDDHPVYVFTFRGERLGRMNQTSWQKTRKKAAKALAEEQGRAVAEYEKFSKVRVHDLKHTTGALLEAAEVPEIYRKMLLGHAASSITDHYSPSGIRALLKWSNALCDVGAHKMPTITELKRRIV